MQIFKFKKIDVKEARDWHCFKKDDILIQAGSRKIEFTFKKIEQ